MTDAIERARRRLRYCGFAKKGCSSGALDELSDWAEDAERIGFAALDCLEVLRGDQKYPSLNKDHAEAWKKFEEAINGPD